VSEHSGPAGDEGRNADVSGGVVVEVVGTVDGELLEAFDRLIPQLSSSSPPPSEDHLRSMIASDDIVLFVARVDGRILGTLTLAFYRVPTGTKAWIEDVVVDAEGRGRGLGELLTNVALEAARARRVKDVSLTSRPSREAANRLYRRIGFEPRETNVYRYTL